MSFYCVIKTEMANKKYIIAALVEMQKRGEITNYLVNEKKEKIEVDRDGELVNITKEKATNNFEVSGISRPAREIANRLKQFYAYESIKDNLPLDFEIAKETEEAGEIVILLKD
ncbi:MAG TPA: hypothetical protein DDX84_08450 [Nitrospiraceae bacterium]|nr:MAG: hypothetical protein A2035_01455 [Nitrospirae bacterium GWA2_42_11]OGW54950.1 MAG: hypothetical protein A2Z60_00885 [Nitrospirae bacterium RIFCSPLOWO2_02_42_7]OGW58874.1 MAG: hypothetical protein A3D21_08695 [Nitrospirae bacterium RIFCSPHIGHO2_02_FULL_42_12]HAS16662.1 hypothetical protein [Nitrospiraceae bacterium]HBI24213.1 hypothetical protein [Nitrospiraceae bacterium]